MIVRHSRSQGCDPGFSLMEALRDQGLFEVTGRAVTAPVTFHQPVVSCVEYFHSTASLARELMPPAESAAFDRAITDIVAPRAIDGILRMQVTARLTWGRPTPGGMARAGTQPAEFSARIRGGECGSHVRRERSPGFPRPAGSPPDWA